MGEPVDGFLPREDWLMNAAVAVMVRQMPSRPTLLLRVLGLAVLLALMWPVGAAHADHLTCNGLTTTIDGTTGDDDLTGTSGDDVVNLLAGNDRLVGAGGNDVICGDAGNDVLIGEAGNDTIFGGPGDDSLDSTCVRELVPVKKITCTAFATDGPGDDALNGEAGWDGAFAGRGIDTMTGGNDDDYLDAALSDAVSPDNLAGGNGNDTLAGGPSDDTIDGGPDGGADIILAGGGADTITAGPGGDQNIDGGAGNDNVDAGAGPDTVRSSPGNDTLNGSDGADALVFELAPGPVNVDLATATSTGDGTDTFTNFESFRGSGFNDVLTGGSEADTLSGGPGEDMLFGGGGSDNLTGDAENDTLRGGAGTDFLQGSAGNDALHGDADNDTLDGFLGDDDLFGGEGDDTLVGDQGDDDLDGGNGSDTADEHTMGSVAVDLAAGMIVPAAGGGPPSTGTNTVVAVENALGGAFADHLLGDSGTNRLDGGPGADLIDGRDGNDTLDGNCGADDVRGGGGDDRLHGDKGDFLDLCAGVDFSNDMLNGGPGSDTVEFPLLFLGGVDVDLDAGTASGEGSDSLAEVENVNGTFAADTLKGTAGVNVLSGGSGDDFLDGRAGNDSEDGGDDTDTCLWDVEVDVLISCEKVPGVVVIRSDAVPDGAQDFGFTGDLGAFSLDDDGDAALGTQTAFPLSFPGSYAVTEAVTSGWMLTAVSCSDPDGGSTTSLVDRRATVDVDARETITCTFRNDQDATGGVPPQPVPSPSVTPVPVTPPVTKPALPAFATVVKLPSTKSCVSRRRFRIRLRIPKGVAASSAEVHVNGKRVRVVKGNRLTAPVDLRGLPKGRFTVRITVKLVDGRSIRGQRAYRTCAPKRRAAGS